jgi:hypothetical protein
MRLGRLHSLLCCVILAAGLTRAGGSVTHETNCDVCVYGGTASGVMAAVAAAREGCRVVIVEPSRWLGGMTGGGLCHIDWGQPEAVGGTARTILKDGLTDPEYREIFNKLVRDHGITVVYEHRLAEVRRFPHGTMIRSITLDLAPPDRFGCPIPDPLKPSDLSVSAKVFIDCSYEGDLMAAAGISHTHGREGRDTYGESLAGVRPNLAVYDIDPYLKPGDPKSGLIPLLQDLRMNPEGSADGLTMGYGFRWKFSFDGTGLPIDPPEHYDPQTYELYRRGFQNHAAMDVGRRMRKPGIYEPEKGHIYSKNAGNLARALLAPTVYGCNAEYPEGDWKTRARIWKFHQDFIRGMTRFLQTDPSVPSDLREQAMKIRFLPGMFDETSGWPHQLYVRESRRMKSSYILTQHDLEGTTDPEDAVGLASYGVDDWPYATFPLDGKVALNGGDFSQLCLDEAHHGIYKIPYRAIVPELAECGNLLVPVCCSASHIAMTSIRMEPVWMNLGESAGVAAALAVHAGLPVQKVPYPVLKERLLQLGQKLERPVFAQAK